MNNRRERLATLPISASAPPIRFERDDDTILLEGKVLDFLLDERDELLYSMNRRAIINAGIRLERDQLRDALEILYDEMIVVATSIREYSESEIVANPAMQKAHEVLLHG